MVHRDLAKDLDLRVGDPVDVTFQNGVQETLPVAGIYEDASLAGNWLVSLDTLDRVTGSSPRTSSSSPSSPTA